MLSKFAIFWYWMFILKNIWCLYKHFWLWSNFADQVLLSFLLYVTMRIMFFAKADGA